MENWEHPRILAMTSSSSSLCSSSKRARVLINGTKTTTVVCSVDGCISDLKKCRDYHRRHKVCEVHSKTPKVMIGGREQHFCQPCSRFHLLVEFDEAKRSCRKRLDGHNRRRRKPQLEPFTINSKTLFSDHQGIGLSPLSSLQLFPSATDRISMWSATIKTDDDAKVYVHHQDNNPVLVLQNQPTSECALSVSPSLSLSLLSSPQPIQASRPALITQSLWLSH